MFFVNHYGKQPLFLQEWNALHEITRLDLQLKMLKWTERKSSNPHEISKVNVEAQGPTILDEEGILGVVKLSLTW